MTVRKLVNLTRLAAVSTLLGSCATGAGTPPAPDPDPERARAALATLRVENQTPQRLMILYRLAGRTAGDVGVGHVEAGDAAEMAPVPAGEPLILLARTATGAQLMMPPRTFVIDSTWTWRIERGSRFVRPRPGGR